MTTRGFEDIPFIQWAARKEAYDVTWKKPDPGVRRRHCFGVEERIDKNGAVRLALSDEALAELAAALESAMSADATAEWAIAVNLLFSYVDNTHELRVRDYLLQRFPDVPISTSFEIAPVWREYERGVTTIMDAYVKPKLSRFVREVETQLHEWGYAQPLAIMKSNGGQLLASTAADQAAQIFQSGLAGGVIGGRYFANRVDSVNAVTLDMGGTSADVALIADREYTYTTSYELEWGLELSLPHIDFTTIGAGGGSIAWIDSGGLLHVGPQSAGADPGPVCYGRGGTEPTVTDANLVLGRLDPDSLLGGRMTIDLDAAQQSLGELGAQLGLSREEAAYAVISTVNENMAGAIRLVTVERGLDHRTFDLVAFGGAGPVHAADIARSESMERVLVPLHPGICSAFGALLADPRVDKAQTVYHRSDMVDLDLLNGQLDELVELAAEDIKREGHTGEPQVARSVSMRYLGQNYEQDVGVGLGTITRDRFDDIVERFHAQHEELFGYRMDGKPIEIAQTNAKCVGQLSPPELPKLSTGPMPDPVGKRRVYFESQGFVECPVYERSTLPADAELDGPAIIQEADSTTVVAPTDRLRVTDEGVLLLYPGALESKSSGESATSGSPTEVDTVTLNVVNNRLTNICDEMASAMIRTAYSTLFSESRDFSTMIFNTDLELVSQADMNPAIICAGLLTVPYVVEEVGIENFLPGDVFAHNDPYRGSCHMPEHLLLKPVFHDGELVAFVANIAHISEIGGMAVGSFAATATEVFQEGLRLPPIKLISEGEYVRDVWRVILANHRTPEMSWGDFHAMLASLTTGERRVVELLEEYGYGTFTTVTKELIEYAERWMRGQIQTIPDGVYSFADYKEDDGVTTNPSWIRASYTVADDEIVVDYSESDPQCAGPMNLSYVSTVAASYTAVLQMISSSDVPLNSGCFRPILVVSPPGTVTNVAYPGSCVAGNTDGQPLVIEIGWGALSQALPERATAAHGSTDPLLLIGGVHPETGQFYAHVHFDGVGWGGRTDGDGNHAQVVAHASLARVAPIEVTETRYPMVHTRLALVDGAEAPGCIAEARGLRASSRSWHQK